MLRPFLNGLATLFAGCALLLLFRFTYAPDPTQSLFLRAGGLENAGQIDRALRAYALISDQHPTSFYAPRALLKQGDLLAAQGTQSGDEATLKRAVETYARLASTYPRDTLAVESLLHAGQISLENLRDTDRAKRFYAQLLERSSEKTDTAATATLKLGQIALQEGDKFLAQTLLQRVLQRWPTFAEQGAQAQFNLGLTYETLWKNKEWATRAYNATIERYPNSSSAANARQKLGLLVFADTKGKPPARRVLIQIDALPDDGASDGSLWSALRLILAAHGVEISETTLDGWSLSPFYAGVDLRSPGRVASPTVDDWENVLASAGLRFSVRSGGVKEAEALRDLQDEIDVARAPLVYFEENGAKIWALCVGYDSERGEVMLQSRGARFDTLSAKSFAAYWKAESSLGESFTLVSLVPTDQKARPNPSLTPTPTPTLAPGATPLPLAPPDIQNAPAFVWELPRISLKGGDNRARQRAALLLASGKRDATLLGAAGLERIAGELNRIAKARPVEIVAPAEPTATPTSSIPVPEAESPYAPDATPTSVPLAPIAPPRRFQLRDDAARARTWLGFLDAPAQKWAQKRREAAAWCDEASRRSKDTSWQVARDALRGSAEALEGAMSLAPSALSSPLGQGDRAQLGEAARELLRAAGEERKAARALGG